MKQYLSNLFLRSGLIDTRWLLVWIPLTLNHSLNFGFSVPGAWRYLSMPWARSLIQGCSWDFAPTPTCLVFPSVMLKQKWYKVCGMKGRGKRWEKDLQVSRQKSVALSSTSGCGSSFGPCKSSDWRIICCISALRKQLPYFN